jgi:hypothetical protein
MDSSPLVRPRHISISVRPIQNFFMSAVDFEVKLNWSFWQWIQGDNDRKVASGTLARHSIAKCYGNPGSSWLELSATPATFCVTSIVNYTR